MIVGLFGKKQTGKTLLSDELVRVGFLKISFAAYLKDLICRLYQLSEEWTTDEVLKEMILEDPLTFNDFHMSLIEKENSVQVFNRNHQIFRTVRQALQYIGTDILRGIDPQFHVNKLASRLDIHKNYVIPDGRFKEEVDFLESIKALCIYIVRPGNKIQDMHASENSINACDFQHVLINNSSKEFLIQEFMKIVERHKP